MVLPWQEEKLQYRDQGSYRFTEEQRNSYLLYFDIKIISFVHQKYENLKSIPNHGFWGYSTVFYGAVPDRKVQQEFVNQRIVRKIGRENLTTATVAQTHRANLFSLQSLATALGGTLILQDEQPPTVLGHPETIVKFKGIPQSQFEFACYWLPYEPFVEDGLLFESEDPTDGDDEYPEPNANDPADPYGGNPPISPVPEGANPRDFGNQGGGLVFGFGEGQYQFRDAASGSFAGNFVGGLGYPGILIKTSANNGNKEISWKDNAGTQTVLVEGASPPVQVQNFTIVPANGSPYPPFVNALSNP